MSASAADLAARPYTKAPPLGALQLEWLLHRYQRWWVSSHKRWDEHNLGSPSALSEGSHDATGGTVGGQVGYRWQAATWVFGVEAQGNWADLHGTNVIRLLRRSPTLRVDAIGLFTGQVGYAANNVLFYIKGGAWGDFRSLRWCSSRVPESQVLAHRRRHPLGRHSRRRPRLRLAPNGRHRRRLRARASWAAVTSPSALHGVVISAACWPRPHPSGRRLVTARLSYRFGGAGTVVARYDIHARRSVEPRREPGLFRVVLG